MGGNGKKRIAKYLSKAQGDKSYDRRTVIRPVGTSLRLSRAVPKERKGENKGCGESSGYNSHRRVHLLWVKN